MSTLKHIEALQSAALDLESQLRSAGAFSRDCAKVHDAIARGTKSGVALLWGADGKLEIVDLNGGSAFLNIRETDHNGVTVETDFSTMNTAGPRKEQHRDTTRRMSEEASAKTYAPATAEKPAAADAAKLAAERKATQDRNTAIAKREYQAGIERTTLIAARMKEASAKIHK
jgi:hypothetical protein